MAFGTPKKLPMQTHSGETLGGNGEKEKFVIFYHSEACGIT
ncbi:hypothetical protein [Flavobacterium gilvum]|nr:hypothetical protein [Flavobacterium gilvum]